MGRPSRYSPEVREARSLGGLQPGQGAFADQFPLELGGTMRPSQILRKLAAYPRQNELAEPCGEVGRVEPPTVHDRLEPRTPTCAGAPGRIEQGRGAPGQARPVEQSVAGARRSRSGPRCGFAARGA